MTAAEAPQLRPVEALGSERDARDAGPNRRRQVAALVRPGVGLQRHFGPGADAEPGANGVEYLGQRVRRKQRGRAAPEIDRVERRAAARAHRPKRIVERVAPEM